jgi:uncharacterized membrane protein (DUF441 family)
MSDKRAAYGADLVIPLAALAFTIYFLVSISGLAWEAKANSVLIAAALIALIGIQAVRIAFGFVRGRGTFTFAPLLEPREAMPKRFGMLAITIAFVAAVPWLGVGLGLFVALTAAFAVMGVKGRGHIVLVSFIAAAVCTILFNAILDTGLPKGPVEKLIEHLVR